MGAPFVAAFFLVIGLFLVGRYLLVHGQKRSETEASQRVNEILASGSLGSAPTAPPKPGKENEGSPTVDRIARWLSNSSVLADEDGRNFIARLDLALIQAGMRSRYTPEQALATALAIWGLGVVLPLLALFVVSLPKLLILPAIAFFAVYPPLKLKSMVQNRQAAIAAEVPFFINDLYMAISTGVITIDQAIVRVARTSEEDPYDSVLPREFAQAHIEYTMGGRTQVDAIRDAGRRTGVVSVQNLCEALIQGIRTGAAMPATLREYSNQAQEMWQQDMRAYKNKKEPMVTVGLVITMFGAFIIYATPMMIGLLKSIGGL